MKLTPHYVVYIDLGNPHGLSISEPYPVNLFDDACDKYQEHRAEGREAIVFRVDPQDGGKAPMMTEVTDDAEERIRTWLRRSYRDIPEWLGGASEEELAREAEEDRKYIATERRRIERV